MLLSSSDIKRTLMHFLLFTNTAQRELVSICTQNLRNCNQLSLHYNLGYPIINKKDFKDHCKSEISLFNGGLLKKGQTTLGYKQNTFYKNFVAPELYIIIQLISMHIIQYTYIQNNYIFKVSIILLSIISCDTNSNSLLQNISDFYKRSS